MGIFEDIQKLFYSLHAKKTAAEISKIFNRERKWVYCREQIDAFVVDYDFIAGLNSLGYEIVLRKKD